MFELDESFTHIQAASDRVVAIITSLNKPDVITTQQRPEPTQAYIISVQEGSGLQMYVYLYHEGSHLARVYPWKGDPITRNTFSDVEGLALEFTESMGFLMDNSHYRKKPPEEREEFYRSLPCFRVDLDSYAAAQEAKEDPSLLDLTENIQDLEEMEIPEQGAAEAAEEPLEMVEIESSPAEELIEVEPEAEALEIETIEEESAPVAEPAAEIDADDPFGEMALEGGEEEQPEGEGFADVLSGLDELQDGGKGKSAADLFGDEDTGDLENELESSIDSILNGDEAAPAAEGPEDGGDDLIAQSLAAARGGKPAEEEDVLEPGHDVEADVSPVVDVDTEVDFSDEPPEEEKPPPSEEFSLDIEAETEAGVEMDVLKEPAPKLSAKAASTFEQMMDEEPPAGAASSSLEEELQIETPSPSAATATAVPRLDPEEARARLEKLGRLLSAW